MHWEEYTENTNTGILHPPKDHSFDTLKSVVRQVKIMFQEGFWLACLVGMTGFGAVLLATSSWQSRYAAEFQIPDFEADSGVRAAWIDSLTKDKGVTDTLRLEQSAQKLLWQNPFYKAQSLILAGLPPFQAVIPANWNLDQDQIQARLENLLRVTGSGTDFSIRLADRNSHLLQAVKNGLEAQLKNQTGRKSNLIAVGPSAFSKEQELSRFHKIQTASWLAVALLTLLITYRLSPKLAKNTAQELPLAFPFPILGLLPENDPDVSPTVLNDAFELLRTNVSMQRSVFSFSSLTLVWPFETNGSTDFLTRMASDYGKTAKKVLVIETAPQTLTAAYGHTSHKGLTDLHFVVKESPPQSEKENEIFWKLYEYVFGTEEKFYCLPYGQASVAPEILFEKYNFRRILNLLKKHFSLILFNTPSGIDLKKALPWSTVQDATLIVANYKKHSTVAYKDELKEITCAQRFLLGGVLVDTPLSTNAAQILKYDVRPSRAS